MVSFYTVMGYLVLPYGSDAPRGLSCVLRAPAGGRRRSEAAGSLSARRARSSKHPLVTQAVERGSSKHRSDTSRWMSSSAQRSRILEKAKKWKQEAVSLPCRTKGCKGRLLVVDQPSDRGHGGGACGSSISVDIEYAHQCPECLSTATSRKTLCDDYDF